MSEIPATVRQSRLRLMLDQPFLASAVAAYPMVCSDDGCATMATDGIRIYVNRRWTSQLEPAEIDFVIAHEVLHCLLGHIDRRGSRNQRLWNLAIDYATNALLVQCGLEMPRQGLYDGRYVGLSAETIYDLLWKDPSVLARGGGDEVSISVGGFDEHLEPDDDTLRPIDLEGSMTALERKRFREVLLVEAQGKLQGTRRGLFSQEVQASTRVSIPWRDVLALFVSGLRKSDYRMFPFNRKHLWNGLYLPSLGVPGPRHLAVAIDTSGSMSREEIALILGEIGGLRATAESTTTVIQCDAAIHEVCSYEAYDQIDPNLTILGRGGTDFRPVFELLAEGLPDQPPVDALIYMTDGYGTAPAEPPEVPTLWVLTESGRAPVDWGTVLYLRAG